MQLSLLAGFAVMLAVAGALIISRGVAGRIRAQVDQFFERLST